MLRRVRRDRLSRSELREVDEEVVDQEIDDEVDDEVDHPVCPRKYMDGVLSRTHSFRIVVDRRHIPWRVAFCSVLYNI